MLDLTTFFDNKEVVEQTINGKVYTCPKQVPAIVAINMGVLSSQGAGLTDSEGNALLGAACDSIFGAGTFEELAVTFTVRNIVHLVYYALYGYNESYLAAMLKLTSGDADTENPPPAETSDSAILENTSDSSSPTSDENTASTSPKKGSSAKR